MMRPKQRYAHRAGAADVAPMICAPSYPVVTAVSRSDGSIS